MKEKVTAGKVWGIIYPGLLYEVIRNVFVILLTMILTVMLMAGGNFTNLDAIEQEMLTAINNRVMLITLITAAISLPLFILLRYRDIEHDKLNNRFIKYERISVTKYILIIPFGIFFMLAANYFVSILVMAMPHSMTASYENVAGYIYGSSMLVQILAAGIIGPAVEEMIYRALVYVRIKKITGLIPAALLSSLLFGIFHGNWVQAPYAFLVGLACVYVYEKYKSIAAPILLHVSANMFSVMLSSMQTAGSEQPPVTISWGEELTLYVSAMLFTGLIAFAVSKIINKTVHPKEIRE